MTLKCQLIGVKCPPYKHHGIFRPDNKTVKSFLPDLTYCAACIANTPPKRTDLHDDLLQVAALTLIDKGPTFDPDHKSGANFRSFIRVRICGALMDVKRKEVKHCLQEVLTSNEEWSTHEILDEEWNTHEITNAARDPKQTSLWQFPDPHAEFESRLVRDISLAAALPELLKMLTPRERTVFTYLREDRQNHEIARMLKLSKSRVSQLVKQITSKLTNAAQRFGLTE